MSRTRMMAVHYMNSAFAMLCAVGLASALVQNKAFLAAWDTASLIAFLYFADDARRDAEHAKSPAPLSPREPAA